MIHFTSFWFRKKFTFVGMLSIIIGSTYFNELYTELEKEVHAWVIVLGIFLVVFDSFKSVNLRGVVLLNTIMILTMQPLPIYLWFEYNNRLISDARYFSKFIAHWGFSFSHIFVLILGVINISI